MVSSPSSPVLLLLLRQVSLRKLHVSSALVPYSSTTAEIVPAVPAAAQTATRIIVHVAVAISISISLA